MRLRAAIFGVVLSASTGIAASAEVRIVRDPGGEVAAYLRKFAQVRSSGEWVVIDGQCLSACTLLLAMVPKNRICVTSRAVLGFHAASLYDATSKAMVPTRSGTRLVMGMYPAPVRQWIERQGGLTPKLMYLRGRDLAAMYRPCR
jgi:hypothetical protein